MGDSFLEGSFNTVTPSALIERRWAQQGRSDMEAINLGISATGPRQYYYRIKKFALQLRPDVIVVFVYAGNDLSRPGLMASAFQDWSTNYRCRRSWGLSHRARPG